MRKYTPFLVFLFILASCPTPGGTPISSETPEIGQDVAQRASPTSDSTSFSSPSVIPVFGSFSSPSSIPDPTPAETIEPKINNPSGVPTSTPYKTKCGGPNIHQNPDNLNTGILLSDYSKLIEATKYSPVVGDPLLDTSADISELLPPPADQGAQPSCGAWVLGYTLMSFYFRQNLPKDQRVYMVDYQKYFSKVLYNPIDSNIDTKRIFSPSFLYNQTTGKNNGRNYNDLFDYIKQHGICEYSNMAYSDQDSTKQPSEDCLKSAIKHIIPEDQKLMLIYPQVEEGSTEKLKDFKTFKFAAQYNLANSNPVLISINIDEEFRNAYNCEAFIWERKPGQLSVQQTQQSGSNPLSHAVVIVGYDNEKNAFKILNSWNTDWGEGGYAWISYDKLSDVLEEAYVLGVPATFQKK
jgi:hypothetical protein